MKTIAKALAVLAAILNLSIHAAQLDQYGGFTGVKGKQTGYFHLEKINERNWFVTPDGNVFFPVGLSHMLSGESIDACEKVYGGDADSWMKDSFKKAQAMGFNCALGSATSPERNLNGFVDVDKAEALFRKANFPYAVGVILLKHPWEFVDGETLPDIFHPEYKQLIESRAKAVCPKYKDDPLVMGYYYGFGAFNRADEWVNHHLSLPANSPGRVAIVDVLIEQYGANVAKFNEAYGTSLQQIADLKSTEELTYEKAYERRNYPVIRKGLNEQKLKDFEAIIQHMCVTLYKIGHNAIRRYDTNHLILGSFIKEWALTADSLKRAAPYVDMLAPQHVNRYIPVNQVAAEVDLPIIFSDEYFGFHYPGGTGSRHAGVKSHDGRGDIYQANLMRHLKDAQTLGVTYCACMFDQGGETSKKNNQNGFYSIEGKPRDGLIEAVTEINRAIYTHAPQPASPNELKKLDEQLWAVWDKNSIKRRRN